MCSLIKIEDLQVNLINYKLTAIIIAKTEPKIFESKIVPGEFNGVWRVTIRDSKKDFLNITLWDSAAKLNEYDRRFNIGTIVDVFDARIAPIRIQDQYYCPEAASSYSMTITGNGANPQGSMDVHEGPYTQNYEKLLKIPSKPYSVLLSLSDANLCGVRSIENNDYFVDLLVVVRVVKPVRNIVLIKTKTTKQYREIVVMDASFPGMTIKLWGESSIKRSNNWTKGTVLFLADVRVSFCHYSKASFLIVSSRSIITEEPEIGQSVQLKMLASNVPVGEIEILNSISETIPDVASIKTVMSVQQIFDRIESGDNEPFTLLCYALVTKFDLDGCTKIYRKICVDCRSYLKMFADYCEKVSCMEKYSNNNSNHHLAELVYDIEMCLSDHTGTISCRLMGKHGEMFLGQTVEEFLALSDAEKAALKWRCLLERCAIKMIVKRKSAECTKNMINIVECVLANPAEVAEKIKIY